MSFHTLKIAIEKFRGTLRVLGTKKKFPGKPLLPEKKIYANQKKMEEICTRATKKGDDWDELTHIEAAENEHWKGSQWARETRCPWKVKQDPPCPWENEHWKGLQWAHENRCSWKVSQAPRPLN